MQLLQKFSIFICLALSCHLVAAQRFPSVHFTIKDGLPSNAVYCIFKDSRGIVWIGTDAGLVKYDGLQFKTFTKKNGLAGNFSRDIKEDKFGNLWIACYGDGLTKFGNNNYTNYTTKNGLVHAQIRTLFFNSKGKLFIGTEKGLSILYHNKFSNYVAKSLSFWGKFQVMQFCEIKNEVYFLSRTHGYFKINEANNSDFTIKFLGKNNSQIHFLNFEKSKYYSFDGGFFQDKTSSLFPIELSAHKKISDILVWDQAVIKNKCFLAAYCPFCSEGGLYVLENNVLNNVSKKYGIESKQVWNLFHDKLSNKLWIATLDKGFSIIDLDPIIHFRPLENLVFFDQNKMGRITIQDKNFAFKSSKFNYTLNLNRFTEFGRSELEKYKIKESNSKEEKIWGNIKIRNQNIKNESATFYNAKFAGICYFVSTSNGIYELAFNGNFKSFFPGVNSEFEIIDSEKLIWSNKHRTIYFLTKNNRFWQDTPILVDRNLMQMEVTQIIKHKRSFFICTKENGILQITPDKKCHKLKLEKLGSAKVVSLEINNDDLFVATNEREVLHYKSGSSIKFIKKIKADLIIGESILSLNYYKNKLLVLTNRGLNILNTTNSVFINQKDGLDFEDVLRSFIYENNYYLTTTKGIFTLNLNQFEKVENPKISIEKIEIKNENSPEKNANKLWHRNKQKELVVDYDQNSITYHLTSNFLYQPEKLEISYSLNNSEWKSVNNQKIYLQELAIGKFDLKLKIRDRASGFYTTYLFNTIVVKPPFYKTTWFILISVLAFFMLGFLIYFINIKRIKKRERQKSDLLKRISETKLEALQSQMNPHFIFNSLTAIHSFIIKSDVDNALNYMDKFSKLTRQTLEFSSMAQISLLDELEYLTHFISLENMRFGNNVEVKIDAGEIDTLKTLVPPLLIQPLVENAFEHGFVVRDKKYQLTLNISIEKQLLVIKLTDNGEGFDTMQTKSESKAMNIIRERLLLIDPTLPEKFTLNRIENHTVVCFSLPLITR
jgi:sensor histidine kinase YesM